MKKNILLSFILMGIIHALSAQVSLTNSQGQVMDAAPVSISFTVPAGTNRVIVVNWQGDPGLSPYMAGDLQYNGTDMTQVGSENIFFQTLGTGGAVTATVSLGGGGNTSGGLSITSYEGVDQTTPINEVQTLETVDDGTTTVTFTSSSSNDLVFDAIAGGGVTSLTTDAAQTEMFNVSNALSAFGGLVAHLGGSTKPGGAGVTMSWTAVGTSMFGDLQAANIQWDGSTMSGSPGAALDFDGSNDYVNLGTDAFEFVGNFTIETWVNHNSSTGRIMDKGISGGEGPVLDVFGGIRFISANGGSGQYTVTAPSTVPANTWTHIAVSVDVTNLTITFYKDGIEVHSAAIPGDVNPNPTLSLALGATNGGINAFDGQLDEFRVWSVVRCPEEIAYYKDCELTGSETNLALYYQFNQGVADGTNTTETTLTDITGNGNDGTLTNFALTGNSSNWVTPSGVTTGNACSGTPTVPEMVLEGGNTPTEIPDGDTTPATADDTDFGTQITGSMTDHTFTIKNSGTATLNLTGSSIVDISGDSEFTIETQPSASSIASGGTDLTFVVRYAPTAAATHTATISIASNDCDENPYTFQVTGMGGIPAAALDFDGTNDKVEIPNSATLDNYVTTGELTLEFWINPTSLSQDLTILSNRAPSNTTGYVMEYYGGVLHTFIRYGNAWIDAPISLTANQWQHIAVVADANVGTKVYVDGILANSTAASGAFSTPATTVMIGYDTAAGMRVYKGQMDELRIWSDVRTCEEIAYYKDCELVGTESGLEVYYQFNQGVDQGTNTGETTLDDLTANNNDGTLIDFALTGISSNWVASGAITTGNTCSGTPTFEVVGTAPINVCTSYSATIPNNNTWTTVNDGSGNPIMGFNAPASTDLGTVTVEIRRNSSIETHDDGNGDELKIMPRYYHVSSSNYGAGVNFPSNVGVRFYFETGDLDAMNAADMGENGMTTYANSEIEFTHYNGPNQDCDLSNNTMTAVNVELINSLTQSDFGCENFILETNVAHFSEFIAHEPTNQPLLPVEWTYFRVRPEEKTALLTWQTATEINNEGFFVQWAMNNEQLAMNEWETIGFVTGGGTTNEVQNYQFTDDRPANGRNYYRLKQMNFDGKFEYSDIQSIRFEKGHTTSVQIFPNPVKDGALTVRLDAFDDETVQIQLYDLTGRIWLQQTSFDKITNLHLNDLVTGVYLIEIASNGQTIRQKVIIE